ncbi:lysozyme inhibitor LprI family protein [Cronobacter muytjensii]|nr:DUF1311 domain-containing protein [Cronobacter muytjensii]
MRLNKITVIVFAMLCSNNVHAGLFSSEDDFKCGRDDAVNAIKHYIKDTAAGLIQEQSMKQSVILQNKPVSEYLTKLDSVQINVTGASTFSNSSTTDVSCQAKISISLPKEVMDVIRIMPEKLSEIQSRKALFNNGSIVWGKYEYSLKLSDDKTSISVTDNMDNVASNELYGSVIMAVNKNELISIHNKNKFNESLSRYRYADSHLNQIWKNMPDPVRESMKASQQTWVKEKVAECGKISDAMDDIKDMDTRIKILNCQTKMTKNRISFFVGDN